MKNKLLLSCGIALALGGASQALWDTHVENEKPDYEEKWDTLSDSGIHVPHESDDRALIAHRTIVLTRDINSNSSHHITAALLLLDRQAPGKPIDLYIRTEGGWVDDAFAIIGVMQTIKSPVNTIGMGTTSSAGAMILAAGTGTRKVLPQTVIMVHENTGADEGEFSAGRAERKREISFWKSSAKLPEKWFSKDRVDNGYFLTPEEALDMNLIDEIVKPLERDKVKVPVGSSSR